MAAIAVFPLAAFGAALATVGSCGADPGKAPGEPAPMDVSLARVPSALPPTWHHAPVAPKPSSLFGDGALTLQGETATIWTWELGQGAGFLVRGAEVARAPSCTRARLAWFAGKLVGACMVAGSAHQSEERFFPDLLSDAPSVSRASGCVPSVGREHVLPAKEALLHVVSCNADTTIFDEAAQRPLARVPDFRSRRAALDAEGTLHMVGAAGPRDEATYVRLSKHPQAHFEPRLSGLAGVSTTALTLAAPEHGPILFAYRRVGQDMAQVSPEPPTTPRPSDETVGEGEPVALVFAGDHPTLVLASLPHSRFEVHVRSNYGWRSLGTPPFPDDQELLDVAGSEGGVVHVLYRSVDEHHGAKLRHAWIDTR